MNARVCKCGQPLPTTHGNRKWCSERCRKNDWAQRNRRECVDCGVLTSSWKATRCWTCRRKHLEVLRLERWAVIKALWDAGCSLKAMVTFPEIGRANANSLGVELDRMTKAGVDLPFRRPNWTGHTRKGGPPRKVTTDHQLVAQRLGYAVRSGKVARPDTCERCGAEGFVEGHHHDYSKPLDVEWLCRPCHMAIHAAEQRVAA